MDDVFDGGIDIPGSQPEKLPADTNELVLDGGFAVPKEVFTAPEINSFGNSFRWVWI